MLAQDWLHGNRAPTKYDTYLEKHLKLPSKFNPNTTLAELNNMAERIVFTDDVPSLLYEMYDNKQITYGGMLATVQLPYDCFWLEYGSTVGADDLEKQEFGRVKYGALVQKLLGGRVGMTIVCGFNKNKMAGVYNSTITQVLEFPHWPPTEKLQDGRWNLVFSIHYAYNHQRLKSESKIGVSPTMQELANIVTELIFGIFLVTHTKVYEAEDVVWNDKLKRARTKRNRPPLLEYRRVHVHIGKGRKVYTRPSVDTARTTTESEADIQHRRYHKVMGHFRHYMKHDPAYTVWIEPHYRGDPSLGVTFIEREVTR